MAFIPAPAGTTRVVINQTLEGQQVVNVMYGKFAGHPTFADLETLADNVRDAWVDVAAGMTLVQAEDLVVANVTATAVAAAGGLQAVSNSGATGAGGPANPPVANSLAGVISLRTNNAGRSNRGRLYIAGIAGSLVEANDKNRLKTTTVDAMETAMTNLFGAFATSNAPLSIVSYYSGVDGDGKPIPRLLAQVTVVTDWVGRTLLGSQRRRRPEA